MTTQIAEQTEGRVEPRDRVYHRTRAVPADRRTIGLTLVNLSPHGLMARVDVDFDVGESLLVTLPVVGKVSAIVRWSLGGRIGCQFQKPIEPRTYPAVLAATGG